MMEQKQIGALAVEAMLYEVTATPKPGLVDRANSGAHADMDFFTFMSSAAALRNYFDCCAEIGAAADPQAEPAFLPALQRIGREAEKNMFAMTGGINTHKGMIFSLGILAACAAYVDNGQQGIVAEDVCRSAARLCRGICDIAYQRLDDKPKAQWTKGEKMYFRYGVTGVRGEAEAGFPSVCHISLPHYRQCRAADMNVNDALVDTLLVLMAETEDTNILGRHDKEKLQWVKKLAQDVRALGGMRTAAGQKAIHDMDRILIAEWVSPGGSADLLAATHFLYEMCR